MMRRKGWAVSTLVAVSMTVGCSVKANSVEFSPEKGEVRSFQLFSRALVRSGQSSTDRSQEMKLGSVLRYDVLDVGRTLRLGITPMYLNQSMDGMRNISSMDSSDRQNPMLLELMSTGFEIDIDSESGQVLRFTNRNESLWKTLLAERLELLKELEQQMSIGMAVPSIPLTEGEVVIMKGANNAADIQITVQSVSDNEVVANLHADDPEIRLTGTMVLERETGWLRRLALVSEINLEAAGSDGSLRQALVMLPEGEPSWLGAWLIDMLSNDASDYIDIQPGPSPEEFEGTPELNADTVLSSAVGTWEPLANDVLLEISHGLPFGAFPGYLDLTGLQIESGEGEVLEVSLHQTMRYAFYDPERRRHTTMAWYVPLGWGDELGPLELAEQLSAKSAVYRPVMAEALDLPLNGEQRTQVTTRDVYAEAIPMDVSGEFLLRFHNTKNQWFSDRIYSANEVVARRVSGMGAADWLTPYESWMLEAVALGRTIASDLHIIFEGENTPESITLFTLSESEPVFIDAPVRFATRQARFADINISPDIDVPLYLDGEEPAQIALENLVLPDVQNNRISLRLPGILAVMCEPSLVDSVEVNGQLLEWQRVNSSNKRFRDHLPTEEEWQLGTVDGRRQSFHDIELESEIRCLGQGKWRTVDVELGDRPWLVRLDDLPGLVDQEEEMSYFLQRYRFIGDKGDALAPMPREWDSDVSLATASIADYLNDGAWLRLAGNIRRVEYLEIDGQPEIRRWSLRYAPLP